MAPFVPECSIHRVPKALLNMNRNAYVPRDISIGPFHHDKQKFKTTEELKLRFFNSYRCRVGRSAQDIVRRARGWERKAREYYSEPINMNSEDFVIMMVLDGCFIVEFMIKDRTYSFPPNENKVHSSFYKAIECNMSVELIMLENQLPFFVLQNLFDLIPYQSSLTNIEVFISVVHLFAGGCVWPNKSGIQIYNNNLNKNPRHLLDFLSSYFVPMDEITGEHHCLPPSATELGKAGIVFKKVEGKGKICIMDISFKDGILNIPPLEIDDKFESCARNLLAFAQFGWEENGKNKVNAIDYFMFLDELITTEKDVNLLAKEGIVINCIGGSQIEISQLFNDICKNITVRHNNYFSHISNDLKQHCDRKRNKWMASLRQNYFHTPWTLISFLAATFLIILTLLQTIFTGISNLK